REKQQRRDPGRRLERGRADRTVSLASEPAEELIKASTLPDRCGTHPDVSHILLIVGRWRRLKSTRRHTQYSISRESYVTRRE
ncbi:hypothetical protein KUCAC02_001263, partial [Chaenocephalus aceratus]